MKIKKILKTGIISWVLLILAWYLASRIMKPDFLASPLTTLISMKDLIKNNTLQGHIIASMSRVLKGWSIGVIIAVPLGLCIGHFKIFGNLIEPVLNFFRFVPAIGFITLFLMWFGVGEESKVALIIYTVIFPVTINTIAGVRMVDKSLVEAAKTMGAGRIRVFFTIVFPSAIPSIFTGIRLGLSGAIICIVAAEMLAASQGLGYLIYTSRLYYKTDWIFVGIFTLGIIGFLADRLLTFIGKKALGRFGV